MTRTFKNQEQSFRLVLGEAEVNFLTKEIQKTKQAMRQVIKSTSSGERHHEKIESLMKNSFGFEPFSSRKVLRMYDFDMWENA